MTIWRERYGKHQCEHATIKSIHPATYSTVLVGLDHSLVKGRWKTQSTSLDINSMRSARYVGYLVPILMSMIKILRCICYVYTSDNPTSHFVPIRYIVKNKNRTGISRSSQYMIPIELLSPILARDRQSPATFIQTGRFRVIGFTVIDFSFKNRSNSKDTNRPTASQIQPSSYS